ncbi:MAG: DUF935 family protein [Rhodobacteraceae bacterium]|nr:DUF935 family protein [Paracoccaceae bacterium]
MDRFPVLLNARGAPMRRRLPVMREAAPSLMDGLLAPYIGELPLNPVSPAREAVTGYVQADQMAVYRQTLRDERCASALEQRLNAAVSKPWEVEPGGPSARDRAAAEDLRERLSRLDFQLISRQLLHAVWYGWAVAEISWMRDGAGVGIKSITVRSPERFWWSDAGGLLLRTLKMPDGEPVPERKFVVMARPGEHGDLPFAPGLARWCHWPVWMKRNGFRFWAVALERFGTPPVVGRYHPSATPAEQDRMLKLAEAAATSLGVAVPENVTLELLEQRARTGDSFEDFVRYCDQLITTVLLGQSSTTDQGAWRGTAEVQRDVRDETVAADVRLLDGALNGTLARWLTEWNFPGAASPEIRHDAEPPEDLDARATREAVISRTTGLRPTERHITDVYGGEWEARPAPEPSGPGGRGGDPSRTAAELAEADIADAVDRAVDRLLDAGGWEPVIEPVIEPVLSAAADEMSLEEFRARLPEIFRRMDDRRLVGALHRLGFTAGLSGAAGLTEDRLDGDGEA